VSRVSIRALVVVGVLVALLLAGGVSYYASSAPDGLNRVAQDQGFSRTERSHASERSPLVGYRAEGVNGERLSRGLAGVAGSLVVLALAGGLTLVVRRGSRRPASGDEHRGPSLRTDV
jgi:cobalt/nickel transport protein